MQSASEEQALANIFARIPAEREAMVHGGERWSFGALDQRSAQIAAWLEARGAGPDDLVAFSLPNGPDFLALTFAIYRCGATPAPLSPKLPDAERDAILATMRPRCFFTANDLTKPKWDDLPPLSPLHVAASWKACTCGGSTGRPPVIVDGRAAKFAATTDFIAIPRDSHVLVPGPLYHNAPFSAAVFALWKGNTVFTMPRFDAETALELIATERIEWALMVPTMMHRIMALPAAKRSVYDLARWKTVVHTAAPMAPWLKRAWIEWLGPDHIWEVHGATEGLVRCWIGGREWLERPGSVGRRLGGARLRITGKDGAELPPGKPGEVYAMPATGPGTSYRYLGAGRRSIDGGGTSVGDIGWVESEGYLFVADRKDDLIISGGINIWPAEVEAALLMHPDVASCAVYGVLDPDFGTIVHAVIETSADLTIAQVGRFLKQPLARAKHPRSISVIDEPVRDDAGKFRKPQFKEPA